MKACTKCGVEKPLSEFDKNGYDPYGKPRLRSSCMECEAIRRAANYSKTQEYLKKWRSENPEKTSSSNRRQYLKRKGVEVIYEPKRGLGDLRKGIDHYREYQRQNKEHLSGKSKEWYAKNKHKVAARKARWILENPERVRIYVQRRRAAIEAGGGKLSLDLEFKLMVAQRGKCACCAQPLKKTGHHLDHIMPLALGGPNEDSNIQLLCPPCNLTKSSKHPVDFMQSKGLLI